MYNISMSTNKGVNNMGAVEQEVPEKVETEQSVVTEERSQSAESEVSSVKEEEEVKE